MKRAKISVLFLTAAVALLLATCSDRMEKEEFATVTISLGNSDVSRMLVQKGDNDIEGEISFHTYELTVIGRNMTPIPLTRNGSTLTGSGVPTGQNLELEIRAYISRSNFVRLDLDANGIDTDFSKNFTSDKILRAFGVSDPVTINAVVNTIAPVNLYSAMEVSNWAELRWAASGGGDGDRVEFIFLKDSMEATNMMIEIERPIIILAENSVTISRGANFWGPLFAIDSDGSLEIGALPEADEKNFYNGAITLDGGNIDCNWPLIVNDGNCFIGSKVTLKNNTSNHYDENSEGTFGGGVFVERGTFTLYGQIKNNRASIGGGVLMLGGSFVMKDGAIIIGNNAILPDNDDPTSVSVGGGVAILGGNFTMEAGAVIEGNVADLGGGVAISVGSYDIDNTTNTANNIVSGTFEMNGGEIKGNVAAKEDGGGVIVVGATFNMSGGSITGNSCKTTGAGGVSVKNATSTYTNTGAVTIISKGTFNMFKPATPGPDGSIKGNTGGAQGTYNFYKAADAIFKVDDKDPDLAYASGW